MLIANFTEVSNSATWSETMSIVDLEDNPLDISSMLFNVWLVYQTQQGPGSARPNYYLTGPNPQGLVAGFGASPLLKADNTNGKLIIDGPSGLLTWTFTPLDMSVCVPGTYEIGVTMYDPVTMQTAQLLVGMVPIISGVINLPQGY